MITGNQSLQTLIFIADIVDCQLLPFVFSTLSICLEITTGSIIVSDITSCVSCLKRPSLNQCTQLGCPIFAFCYQNLAVSQSKI